MNERIQALMDEAVSFRLDPDSNAYEALVSPEDLAVFAELIVQECLTIVKNREDELESAGLIEESNTVGVVAYRISRQFGVKR